MIQSEFVIWNTPKQSFDLNSSIITLLIVRYSIRKHTIEQKLNTVGTIIFKHESNTEFQSGGIYNVKIINLKIG